MAKRGAVASGSVASFNAEVKIGFPNGAVDTYRFNPEGRGPIHRDDVRNPTYSDVLDLVPFYRGPGNHGVTIRGNDLGMAFLREKHLLNGHPVGVI